MWTSVFTKGANNAYSLLECVLVLIKGVIIAYSLLVWA
jgi:hypothetical protein